MRKISAALGFAGLSALGVIPSSGCGSALESVAVRPGAPKDGVAMPRITEERMSACITEYAKQLDPGSWAFSPELEVTPDGSVIAVHAGDIPKTAPDFAACARDALSNMVVPDVIFNLRRTNANATPMPATAEQRTLLGSPVVVVVVVVGMSEVVLEAGAYTILFAVTVKVVEKVGKDIAEKVEEEGWKAQCIAHYVACMGTATAAKAGNHIKQTRCGICLAICKNKETWPSDAGNGSCEYWQRNWK